MPVRAWFDELHRDVHLGAFGRNYSELAASWIWVIALAGLALWTMRRRENRAMRDLVVPDRTASGRRRTLSWHGAVGVWIVPVLLALSVSGITWSRYAGETVNGIQAQLSTTAPPSTPPCPVHRPRAPHTTATTVVRPTCGAPTPRCEAPSRQAFAGRCGCTRRRKWVKPGK